MSTNSRLLQGLGLACKLGPLATCRGPLWRPQLRGSPTTSTAASTQYKRKVEDQRKVEILTITRAVVLSHTCCSCVKPPFVRQECCVEC
jgi:hypothetical protein